MEISYQPYLHELGNSKEADFLRKTAYTFLYFNFLELPVNQQIAAEKFTDDRFRKCYFLPFGKGT